MVPNSRDAEVLQVLCRQVRQDTFIDVVFAEAGFILSKAKASFRTRSPVTREVQVAGCRAATTAGSLTPAMWFTRASKTALPNSTTKN